jgi:ankyrin repeat protein
MNPIWEAVKQGNLRILRNLLTNKELRNQLDTKNPSGFTVLHLATKIGNFETVKLLIQHGANPNVKVRIMKKIVNIYFRIIFLNLIAYILLRWKETYEFVCYYYKKELPQNFRMCTEEHHLISCHHCQYQMISNLYLMKTKKNLSSLHLNCIHGVSSILLRNIDMNLPILGNGGHYQLGHGNQEASKTPKKLKGSHFNI